MRTTQQHLLPVKLKSTHLQARLSDKYLFGTPNAIVVVDGFLD